MTGTTHLDLPLLAAAQAQKHVTLNEALTRLDAVVQLSVRSRSIANPPASAGEGERWIVGAAPPAPGPVVRVTSRFGSTAAGAFSNRASAGSRGSRTKRGCWFAPQPGSSMRRPERTCPTWPGSASDRPRMPRTR